MVRVVVSFVSKLVLGIVTAVLLCATPLPEWCSQSHKEAAAFAVAALCVAWSLNGKGRLPQALRVILPIALMTAAMADPWVRGCPQKLSEGVFPFVSSVAAKVEQGAKWVREKSSPNPFSAPAPPAKESGGAGPVY